MNPPEAVSHNAAVFLHPGAWFSRAGQLFEILVWDTNHPLDILARLADTQQEVQFTLTELFAPQPLTRFGLSRQMLEASPEAKPPSLSIVDGATLPPHLLQRADQIIQTVDAVQTQVEQAVRAHRKAGEPYALTELTRQACQGLAVPVSRSAYYAYRQIYQTHAGDRALVAAALRRKSFGKTRLDPNAQHFVDTLIQRFYRSNPPLRVQTVYTIAQQIWRHNRHWWVDVAKLDGPDLDALVEQLLDARHHIDDLFADPQQTQRLVQIQLPCRSWFYAYLSWFGTQPGAGEQVYVTRRGQADWDTHFRLFDRFLQSAVLPLQYVFADHYRLDLLHVDDEYREVLGRLWLSVLIDAFSRCILGIYLAYEDPCIESIQGALRSAIWPKTDLAQYGIDLPWNCFGIPERLFLDNAWAHQSYSLEDLTRALAGGGRYTHLELVFRPPYQARYGALVERLFGNLSGQIRERLPGAILRPDQRQWHNAHQGACLLYRDVIRLVYQMVVDYLHTPHRELDGLTPHEKWMQGLQLMTPLPPPLTPQLERVFWRLVPQPRRATQDGLALFGLHYWDVGLHALRSRNRQGQRRQFHLHYDPLDVSRVAVFEEGLWLGDGWARELRLPDGRFEAVSLWELELAKDVARQKERTPSPRPDSWLVHLLEARELIAQRQSEQRQIRRKVQQLRERKRGHPTQPQTSPSPEGEPQPVPAVEQAPMTPTRTERDPRDGLLEHLTEVL
jgi:putative transposase